MKFDPLRKDLAEEPTQRIWSTANVLSVLTFLFAMRVIGQLVQSRWEVPVIPTFESWQSGALSYGDLLLTQLGLIVVMIAAIYAVLKGKRFDKLGVILCYLGCSYLVILIFRAVIGFFELSEYPWFDQPLPIAFHFVLATFITILGWYWAAPRKSREIWHEFPSRAAPFLAYPLTMLCALCLFSWLAREGMNQAFSAYLAVALGAAVILIHELLLPYRNIWLPSSRTVTTDIAYLILVQMLLPTIFSLVVVGGLVYGLQVFAVDPVVFWPQDWPLALQVILMMLIADLLRYWLHRASHKIKWLWALHAVHHAPKQLYSLNVGRFHPGDKALQFLFDALPFGLMGVSRDVLITYFVFYAINGFFQHSNATLKLGPLNWIIAGPELHRWHHAKAQEHSNFNFGNNLIIWDNVFGTRHLPSGDQVGELGIGNSRYPEDLVGQTMAPFVSDPDIDTRQ